MQAVKGAFKFREFGVNVPPQILAYCRVDVEVQSEYGAELRTVQLVAAIQKSTMSALKGSARLVFILQSGHYKSIVHFGRNPRYFRKQVIYQTHRNYSFHYYVILYLQNKYNRTENQELVANKTIILKGSQFSVFSKSFPRQNIFNSLISLF